MRDGTSFSPFLLLTVKATSSELLLLSSVSAPDRSLSGGGGGDGVFCGLPRMYNTRLMENMIKNMKLLSTKGKSNNP